MIKEQVEIFSPHLARLRARAFTQAKRIVLTDGTDRRVLAATRTLVQESAIRPILVGQAASILPHLEHMGISGEVDVYDPDEDPRQHDLVHLLRSRLEKRGKAIPEQSTVEAMARQPIYSGMLLVQAGLADGLVGGATSPTATVLRASMQVVGIEPRHPVVSGAFALLLAERLPAGQDAIVLGDVAVVPNPSAEQLASIAINTAQVAQAVLGEEPIVAFLSFSTYGSAKDASVTKVREALWLVRQRAPALCVEGELQADAALIPEVSLHKAPGNTVQGRANVLIFPNLDAGNIAYKMVERIGRATALGVILSGLAKPINDLSRGCSASDIVNMVAVTALQAAQK
ncbi:MAG: phosphotransacetylase [Chloroflexi bacterium]|nr:MAG: phosphotransacetylase [Chloroflexota bacterium]